jgi:hypothetical protein
MPPEHGQPTTVLNPWKRWSRGIILARILLALTGDEWMAGIVLSAACLAAASAFQL